MSKELFPPHFTYVETEASIPKGKGRTRTQIASSLNSGPFPIPYTYLLIWWYDTLETGSTIKSLSERQVLVVYQSHFWKELSLSPLIRWSQYFLIYLALRSRGGIISTHVQKNMGEKI